MRQTTGTRKSPGEKIIQFEVRAWANQLLSGTKPTTVGLTAYLQEHVVSDANK
jgi:hypothetical protein